MRVCEFEGNADILQKTFTEYVKEKLQNCCSHVKKTEENCWQ
jgi:hypothetical protein